MPTIIKIEIEMSLRTEKFDEKWKAFIPGFFYNQP